MNVRRRDAVMKLVRPHRQHGEGHPTLAEHLSGRCWNWPFHCAEWSGDRKRSPDEGEAEVLRQLERSDRAHGHVVRHRRHQGDRVADEQHPPCPALTAITVIALPMNPNKTQ